MHKSLVIGAVLSALICFESHAEQSLEKKLVNCLFSVNGAIKIKGKCWYVKPENYANDYLLMASDFNHTLRVVFSQSGKVSAWYNSKRGSDSPDSIIDNLLPYGTCWQNSQAKVCAWDDNGATPVSLQLKDFQGLWAISDQDCQDPDGPNFKTFISATQFNQYESSCKITDNRKVENTLTLDLNCDQEGEFRKASVKITPLRNNRLLIEHDTGAAAIYEVCHQKTSP